MLLLAAVGGCYRGWPSVVPPPSLERTSMRTRPAPVEPAVAPRDDNIRGSTRARFASFPTTLEPDAEPRSWRYIIVHHSATDSGDVAGIDADHKQRLDSQGRPWLGIGYHFVIGNGQGMRDGLVEPTFRWREQLRGAHAGSRRYNERGIGVCLVGDFNRGRPTPRQMASLRQLLAWLERKYDIAPDDVLRHSDVRPSDCPGRLFPWDSL